MSVNFTAAPFAGMESLGPTEPPQPFDEVEFYGERLGAYASVDKERAPDTWETPVPFDGLNLPQIDPSFLPPEFREYCEGICHELQVPVELVVGSFLAMVGTCVQGKFVVRVRQNYEEELCTAWSIALPPSERKSPVVARLKKPAQKWILERNTAMKEEIARVSSERHVLTMTIEDKKGCFKG